MCLEVVWGLQSLANDTVVIDFAIDSEGKSLVLVGQRLCTTF